MDQNGDHQPGSAYQSNGLNMSNGHGPGPGSSSQARRRYRFEPDSSSSSPGVSPTLPTAPATKSNGVHNDRGPSSGQPDTNGTAENGNPNPNASASPPASRPASINTETASLAGTGVEKPPQRYFHSRRVKPGDVEKPWTKNVDPKEKWVTILPLLGIALGLAISGLLIWDGIRSVVKHQYCLVYEDDFSSGVLNEKIWEREVQLGGFGYVFPLLRCGGDDADVCGQQRPVRNDDSRGQERLH